MDCNITVFTIVKYGSEYAQITTLNLNKVRKSAPPSVFTCGAQWVLLLLTRRSTGVDQNVKSDKVMSELSVTSFIFLRTHLVAQK